MSYAKHPGGYPRTFPKWNSTAVEPGSRAGTACRGPLQRRGGGPGDVVLLEEGFGVGDGNGGALGEAALRDAGLREGGRGGDGSRRRGFLGSGRGGRCSAPGGRICGASLDG
jgi:hypothetical protein